MGDLRRDAGTWVLVGAGALLLAPIVGPPALLTLPSFLLTQVPSELARLAVLAWTGAGRPRLRPGVLTIDVTFDGRRTARQTAISDSAALLAMVVVAAVAFAVVPWRYALPYAAASVVMVGLQSGFGVCIWHDTIAEKVHKAREAQRAEAVLAAVDAVPEGPRRFDAMVDILAPAVARDPRNQELATHLVLRLMMALRFEEAARELARMAVFRGVSSRARTRALLGWADLTLSQPDVLGPRLPKAVSVVRTTPIGCGFVPQYLRALTALRTGEPESAIAHADDAIARWKRGDDVSLHAVSATYGIRALALLALGRRDEAEATVAEAVPIHSGCALPDMLQEAQAVLAA